jgi:molecular chaperone DnaK
MEEFKNQEGEDLSGNAEALQRLKDAAEKAKIELSSAKSTDINLPYISFGPSGAKHLVRSLTKAKFEQLAHDLIQRSVEPCKQALQDAGLSLSEIDEVIMVGGSTRIPAIQEAVEKFFNKKPNRSVNPDEVVALGAAIQGGVLSGDVKDVLLLDVTPLSLGIETMGGVFTKVIEANTTIPSSKSQIFSTAQDNQPSVEINVLQGERPMAKDNRSIGRFNLDGIPPMRRGEAQIEVTFDIDANGILKVSAKENKTGKEQSIRIEASTGLSEDEIQRMKNEAEANAETDQKAKENIDKINEADSVVFQTEKQLEEYGDKIPAEAKTEIETAVTQLKEAHQRQDIDAINRALEAVNTAWAAATQNMDPNAAAQNSQAENNTTQESDTENEDVTDVEFEEVDK